MPPAMISKASFLVKRGVHRQQRCICTAKLHASGQVCISQVPG